MAGRATAPKSGEELKHKVVDLAHELGLKAETEVTAARRLWGAKRRIDVVLVNEVTGKTWGLSVNIKAGAVQQKKKSLQPFKIFNSGRFQEL